MTEEIIIDGVNVAGCCCYENGKCLWTKRYYESDVAPDCEKIKDCYYKQLKRLEQENKELKTLNEKICEDWEKEIKVYWNALEEIREILLLPDMPEVKEQTIITSTMLDEIVRANRENKLQKIKQTIYEVLNLS